MPPETAPPPNEPEAAPVGAEYSEAFAAIDQLPSEGPTPGSAPQPEAKPPAASEKGAKAASETPKGDDTPSKDEKPATAPKRSKKASLGEDVDSVLAEKKEEAPAKPASEAKPATDFDTQFETPGVPKALRDHYKATKAELETARKQLEETSKSSEKAIREAVKAAVKEHEERLEASERRRASAEERLRVTDYTRTEEYEAQFNAPIEKAWEAMGDELGGIQVKGEDGNDRAITKPDMLRLMGMNNTAARKFADEEFGIHAASVMQFRAKMMGMFRSRAEALEKAKEASETWQKNAEQHRLAKIKSWEDSISNYREDYPDLFGQIEGDDEGNQLIATGDKLVQLAFLGKGLPDNMSPEERGHKMIEAQVLAALRASAYGRQVRDLKRANARIAELEKKLKDFEGSEPRPGGGGEDGDTRVPGSHDAGDPEAAIDALPGYYDRA